MERRLANPFSSHPQNEQSGQQSASQLLTHPKIPPVVEKSITQENTVWEFNRIFKEIDTLLQSLPRHSASDRTYATYTWSTINSWFLHNLGFINAKNVNYPQQRQLLQESHDKLYITIKHHFGSHTQVVNEKINEDPQQQFLIVLQQFTRFYYSMKPTYQRSYKHNAAYLSQQAVMALFTNLLSTIAFTHIPLDYYFAEYFTELRNINCAINKYYLIIDPPSTVPVTYYKPFGSRIPQHGGRTTTSSQDLP